jgi:gamma-glutamyl-gamma-aminobutyrate hydrolase PuuD
VDPSRSILQHLRSYRAETVSSIMPLVVVSQRVDGVPGRDEIRDSVDQKLLQWVIAAGFLPVTVPNILSLDKGSVEPTLDNWLLTIRPSGLLLSGGNDIGEYPLRDATERFLLDWAAERLVPVIGICRGMQLMASWAGVKLVKVAGHVRTRHELQVSDYAYEWPSEVNSYHNWALSACPADFEIAAKAEDGYIEAIKHKVLPWEGWMWHPERESSFQQKDIERIRKLFNA